MASPAHHFVARPTDDTKLGIMFDEVHIWAKIIYPTFCQIQLLSPGPLPEGGYYMVAVEGGPPEEPSWMVTLLVRNPQGEEIPLEHWGQASNETIRDGVRGLYLALKMDMWGKEATELGIPILELCSMRAVPMIDGQAREIGDPWRSPIADVEEEEDMEKHLEETQDEAETDAEEQGQREDGRATESEGREGRLRWLDDDANSDMDELVTRTSL